MVEDIRSIIKKAPNLSFKQRKKSALLSIYTLLISLKKSTGNNVGFSIIYYICDVIIKDNN